MIINFTKKKNLFSWGKPWCLIFKSRILFFTSANKLKSSWSQSSNSEYSDLPVKSDFLAYFLQYNKLHSSQPLSLLPHSNVFMIQAIILHTLHIKCWKRFFFFWCFIFLSEPPSPQCPYRIDNRNSTLFISWEFLSCAQTQD